MDARTQFGREAEKYLTSTTHADPGSLAHCVDLAKPNGGRFLDIATGAGHLAFAFAPLMSEVIALDITEAMLEIVERESVARGLGNISTVLAPAEELPFPAEHFEGVGCRVAPHHFHDVRAFVAEVVRVLKPGGFFILVDTLGIDDPLHDEALQHLETIRDPSHVRNLTPAAWVQLLEESGLAVEAQEIGSQVHETEVWLDRMSVEEPTRSRIHEIIRHSEGALREYLEPGEGTFTLRQGTFLSRKVLAD